MAQWPSPQELATATVVAVRGRFLTEPLEDDQFVREADLAVRETYRAELWSKSFLGLSGGHLCKTFGFNKNSYSPLAAQMLTAFVILKLLMYLGHRCWLQPPQAEEEEDVSGPEDPAIEELSRFNDMVEDRLGTLMTQVDNNKTEQAAAPSAAPHHAGAAAAGPQAATAEADSAWQRDVEALKAEVQQRVAGIKDKWAKEKVTMHMPQPLKVSESESNEGWMAIVYLRGQAILSCVVLLQIGVSISTVPHEHDAWSTYCLFAYAYVNCGLMPSALLGVAYVIGLIGHPLFLVPQTSERPDPSYQPLPTDITGSTVASAKKSRRINREQARQQATIALIPSFVPLACVAITHVVPFTVLYVWVAVIVLMLSQVIVRLAQLCDPLLERLVQLPGVSLFLPAQRGLRQAELASIAFQVFAGVFVLMSVLTMTRVYAGEFHHGGYLDQLLEHLIKDERIWMRSPCGWSNVNRIMDFMLRWS